MTHDGPLAGGTTSMKVAVVVLAALIMSGCSGGASPSVQSAQEVATTVSTVATTVPPVVASTMEVRLVIDGKPTVDTVDVADFEDVDPFGSFASCSGLRSAFGAYQMLLSGSEALGGSVQVNSTSNPHDPGTVSANARIESDAQTVDVQGSLDLSEDFRSGRFLGNTAAGSRVVIEFDCQSALQPAPLDRTRPYVDIALLMVKNKQRRVLSMGLASPCNDKGIDSEIPAEEGPPAGLSRAVINPDKLELFVGGKPLKFDQSSVSVTSSTAGTFNATTADGAKITGAYSCRG